MMADQRAFDDNDFGEHYRNRYGRTGRPYQDYQPAYRFGWEMARDQRHAERDWQALEQDARREWERSHPQERWEDKRDAISEGFSRGRGVRRSNFGAMEGPGEGDPGVNQVSSGLRSGGTGDVTNEPQGEGTFPAPSRSEGEVGDRPTPRARTRDQGEDMANTDITVRHSARSNARAAKRPENRRERGKPRRSE